MEHNKSALNTIINWFDRLATRVEGVDNANANEDENLFAGVEDDVEVLATVGGTMGGSANIMCINAMVYFGKSQRVLTSPMRPS